MVGGQLYKMNFIKNFFYEIYYSKYSKTSYSISSVDLIIDRIFKDIKKGIYIDVGVQSSN